MQHMIPGITNIKAIRQLFMDILHFKIWGIQRVSSRMQFECLFSHLLYIASDATSLCQIV